MSKIPLEIHVAGSRGVQRCDGCGRIAETVETTLMFNRRPIRRTALCQACLKDGVTIDLGLDYGTDHNQSHQTQQRLKAARTSERRVAQDLGGRVQPASGAVKLCHCKADVRCEDWLVEVKYTDALRYQLRVSELEKVGRQASRTGDYPALVVDFRQLDARYVVLPFSLFQELTHDKTTQHRRPGSARDKAAKSRSVAGSGHTTD